MWRLEVNVGTLIGLVPISCGRLAVQANLRVVRHQFEGTSQAGNVGASHDEADVFDVDPLGKRAGCKVLEKEFASFREKVEGRPA